jgi:hypothetical protein
MWSNDQTGEQISDQHRLTESPRDPAANEGSRKRGSQIEYQLAVLHAAAFVRS